MQVALAGLSAGYGELDTDSAGARSQLDGPTGSVERPFIFPRWQDTRPVVIGLDFGTYSTKVVVRIRGEKKSRVLVFDEPAAGYPSFVSPSLVRMIDGRLFFGRLASQKTGGTLFRSLKVSLLPPTSTDGWQQESFPVGTGAAEFRWQNRRFPGKSAKCQQKPVWQSTRQSAV